jgi:hypothetical protein
MILRVNKISFYLPQGTSYYNSHSSTRKPNSGETQPRTQAVEDWLGPSKFSTLCRLLLIRDKNTSTMYCQFTRKWQMSTMHNDSDRLRCLQNAVNMELHKRGNSHLSVTIGPGTFSNFLSLESSENCLIHIAKYSFFIAATLRFLYP